ncbi:hypothetical protein [Streptomyces sp. NPDC005322]|uniref:hypothetical protein n=1 Tax=Streptomyces sp. NPDC005322 TaxID=3157032 RepID=UPI0033BBB336
MDPQSDVAERAPSRPLRPEVVRKGPVFVDLSGRRGRLVRHAGVVAGAVCLGYSAVLGVGFVGGTALAPETLIPGRPLATEAFGREPKSAPDGHSGARRPTAEHSPNHRQSRLRPEHRHSPAQPRPLAARQPATWHAVTTQPRPAPPQPATSTRHTVAPRPVPAHPRPTGHAPGGKPRHAERPSPRHPSPAHTRPGAGHSAKPPVDKPGPSKKPSAGAKPPSKSSAKSPGHSHHPNGPKNPRTPQKPADTKNPAGAGAGSGAGAHDDVEADGAGHAQTEDEAS